MPEYLSAQLKTSTHTHSTHTKAVGSYKPVVPNAVRQSGAASPYHHRRLLCGAPRKQRWAGCSLSQIFSHHLFVVGFTELHCCNRRPGSPRFPPPTDSLGVRCLLSWPSLLAMQMGSYDAQPGLFLRISACHRINQLLNGGPLKCPNALLPIWIIASLVHCCMCWGGKYHSVIWMHEAALYWTRPQLYLDQHYPF